MEAGNKISKTEQRLLVSRKLIFYLCISTFTELVSMLGNILQKEHVLDRTF